MRNLLVVVTAGERGIGRLQKLLEHTDAFRCVIDNASPSEVTECLDAFQASGMIDLLMKSDEHIGSGEALNEAVRYGVSRFDAELITAIFADQPMEGFDDWFEIQKVFTSMPSLGQFGLNSRRSQYVGTKYDTELPWKVPANPYTENGATVNAYFKDIKPPHVIRRELWDLDVRWNEAGLLDPHPASFGYNSGTIFRRDDPQMH